ncbi:MAG: DUF4097 family beta strand repeat-containing protein [Bryobacteraceae bacterium]
MRVSSNLDRFLLMLALAVLPAFAADVKDVHRTFPLSANGQLTIDTYKGFIKVTTWDRAEVDIQARIESDDSMLQDARDIQDTEIRFDASSNSVRVKTDYSRIHQWFRFNTSLPRVRYTISMPRTAELRIKDYKSEADVSGLRSRLDIHTYKGSVRVRDFDGSIQAYTYKGDMKIEMAGIRDRSKLDTYRGDYELTLPRNARFDLEGDNGRRGTIDSDFPRTVRSSRDYREFRGQINGGGPVLLLKSYRGTFRLRAR